MSVADRFKTICKTAVGPDPVGPDPVGPDPVGPDTDPVEPDPGPCMSCKNGNTDWRWCTTCMYGNPFVRERHPKSSNFSTE